MVTKKKAKRGAVELTDSEGHAHTLKFGTNAICRIQDELGKPLGAILDDLKDETKLDMKVIRTMVQMALVTEEEVTPEMAGDLIDDVGLEAITKGFGAVFMEEKGSANPTQAPTGVAES